MCRVTFREFVERGFEVAVAADASAAAKAPGLDGMIATLTNYRMIASDFDNQTSRSQHTISISVAR